MPVHTPIELPAGNVASRPSDNLTPEQEKQLKVLLEKFSDEGYMIPGEKDPLKEEERFWLVSAISSLL